jgi:hypothetical protein
MRNFLRALLRLRFKRRNRIAREAKPYNLSQMEVYPCDKFTGKPQHYSPQKEWRLLAHIGDTGTTAKIEQTHDIELNEELLERTDFLACLFGTGKTW